MDDVFADQVVRIVLIIVFIGVLVVFFVLDLGVFQKEAHKVSTRSALWQSGFWVGISVIFGFVIYFFLDADLGMLFFLAYVTEKSLSLDNIFVWMIILQYLNIQERYYHRVLFYGVMGAIAFRFIFITVGFYLLEKFSWILYLFGVFLIFSGLKLLFRKGIYDPVEGRMYKFLVKNFQFVEDDSGRFLVKKDEKSRFTMLFLTLILIELTDILFALDSIPAVFAITTNEFIVYTSNVFAVLGLRALFFLLSGVINRFRYLDKGLSIILIFIGLKMFAEITEWHIPTSVSLAIVLTVLSVSILLSIWKRDKSLK
ncbi:MAG TPA: TerC/Alx family metal homeostasis membrane protein [Cytophagaceae bacterium]